MNKKTILIIGIIIVFIIAVVYKIFDYSKVLQVNNFNPFNRVATGYATEEIVSNLASPSSLTFTSKDRFLVAERSGNIRIIENKELKNYPLASFPEAATTEAGIMDIAVAPSYEQTKHVFICLAYKASNKIKGQVIRFEDRITEMGEREVIIDGLELNQEKADCKLLINDDKIFVANSDKIMRYNLDGSIPKDNPSKSPIWSSNHQDIKGLALDSANSLVWSLEKNKISVVEKDKDYKEEKPSIALDPTLNPLALSYYNSDALPFFKNNLFISFSDNSGLYKESLDNEAKAENSIEKLADINYAKIIKIAVSPEGLIYLISDEDNKIYRLVQKF